MPDCLSTATPCDPLIEEVLGLGTGVRARNLARIATINQRTPTPSWTAGETSLIDSSYAEVLAHRTGELPPATSDRRGPRNLAAMTVFLASLAASNRRSYRARPLEWEVYSSDADNQGVCSSCSAFAVTLAMETCVQRSASYRGFSTAPPRGLSQQHLLDCAFNSYGLAGCDGGQAHR